MTRRRQKYGFREITGIFMMSILTITFIWLGIKLLIDNNQRELEEVKSITGEIEHLLVAAIKSKVGSDPSVQVSSNFFVIKIRSSNEILGTYKAKQKYDDLFEKLRVGDTVKSSVGGGIVA